MGSCIEIFSACLFGFKWILVLMVMVIHDRTQIMSQINYGSRYEMKHYFEEFVFD